MRSLSTNFRPTQLISIASSAFAFASLTIVAAPEAPLTRRSKLAFMSWADTPSGIVPANVMLLLVSSTPKIVRTTCVSTPSAPFKRKLSGKRSPELGSSFALSPKYSLYISSAGLPSGVSSSPTKVCLKSAPSPTSPPVSATVGGKCEVIPSTSAVPLTLSPSENTMTCAKCSFVKVSANQAPAAKLSDGSAISFCTNCSVVFSK